MAIKGPSLLWTTTTVLIILVGSSLAIRDPEVFYADEAVVPLASRAVVPAVERVPANQQRDTQHQGKRSTRVDLPPFSVGLCVAFGCVVATVAASRASKQPQDDGGGLAQELTLDELELLTAALTTCERLVKEAEELPAEMSSVTNSQNDAADPAADIPNVGAVDRRGSLRSELQATIEQLSELECFAGSKAKLVSLYLKRALAALNEMDAHGSELELTARSANDVLSVPLALTVSAAEEHLDAAATITGGDSGEIGHTSITAAAEGGVTAGPLDRILAVATAASAPGSAASPGGLGGQGGQDNRAARLTLHVNEIREAMRTAQNGAGSFDYDERRLPNLLMRLNDSMVRDAASRSRDIEQLCSKSKSDVKNAHRDADKKLDECQQAMQLKRARHADKHRKRMAELATKIKEQTEADDAKLHTALKELHNREVANCRRLMWDQLVVHAGTLALVPLALLLEDSAGHDCQTAAGPTYICQGILQLGGVFKMAVVALLLLLNSVLWYLGTGLVGSMGVLAGTGFLIKAHVMRLVQNSIPVIASMALVIAWKTLMEIVLNAAFRRECDKIREGASNSPVQLQRSFQWPVHAVGIRDSRAAVSEVLVPCGLYLSTLYWTWRMV